MAIVGVGCGGSAGRRRAPRPPIYLRDDVAMYRLANTQVAAGRIGGWAIVECGPIFARRMANAPRNWAGPDKSGRLGVGGPHLIRLFSSVGINYIYGFLLIF